MPFKPANMEEELRKLNAWLDSDPELKRELEAEEKEFERKIMAARTRAKLEKDKSVAFKDKTLSGATGIGIPYKLRPGAIGLKNKRNKNSPWRSKRTGFACFRLSDHDMNKQEVSNKGKIS